MPNHVRNKVKMTGIANLPLFTTKTDEYTKEQFTFFDFNKLIPMPESLNIESGSSEDVAIEAVLRKMSKRRFGFLSNKYGKMTDDEYERRKKAHGKTDEELAKIGLQYISNKYCMVTQHGTTGRVKTGVQSGTHTIMNRLMRTRFCSAQLGATRNRSCLNCRKCTRKPQ